MISAILTGLCARRHEASFPVNQLDGQGLAYPLLRGGLD